LAEGAETAREHVGDVPSRYLERIDICVDRLKKVTQAGRWTKSENGNAAMQDFDGPRIFA
jgi:hypothetical protein